MEDVRYHPAMADHDGYMIKALTRETWDAFADLAERHNGGWGGC